MGWASASRIVIPIINILKREVLDEEIRKKIYEVIIPAFEEEDWDTQDDCLRIDSAFDVIMIKLHPRWSEQ